MDTVSHAGRTTTYRRGGGEDGPTVCYIHGAGGSHEIWTEQYSAQDTPPAVAVDLSGHGESDDVSTAPGRETLDAYADDVAAVCADTGATVLCGNSMGGAVAMWTVLEGDLEVDALVLADTGAKLSVDSAFLDGLETDFEATVESLHAPGTLFHEPTDRMIEPSKRSLEGTGQSVTLRDFETCDAFDIRDRVAGLTVPTLAVCGEHDPMTPPAFHEYLAAELPDCVFREIADAAHLPMLERPAAFDDTVRSFLDR